MAIKNLKTINYKELDAWVFDNSEHLVLAEEGAKVLFSLLSLRGEYVLLDEEHNTLYMYIPGFSEPIRAEFEDILSEARAIYSQELHRTEERLRKLSGMDYNVYRKRYEQLLTQGRELSLIELCNSKHLKEARV